jgi:hypothetical protein
VPSCDTCDRHWTPTSLRPDGTCPTCGRKLELKRPLGAPAGDGAGPEAEAATEAGTEVRPSAPWHFKVLLVALIVYLGWRGVQGVDWIARHL